MCPYPEQRVDTACRSGRLVNGDKSLTSLPLTFTPLMDAKKSTPIVSLSQPGPGDVASDTHCSGFVEMPNTFVLLCRTQNHKMSVPPAFVAQAITFFWLFRAFDTDTNSTLTTAIAMSNVNRLSGTGVCCVHDSRYTSLTTIPVLIVRQNILEPSIGRVPKHPRKV